jgi:Tfp pilus assembly protein PilV
MKVFRRILSSSRGNSLVEILIALALTGIITTAVLGLYYRQHRNYMIQDDVTNIQATARASIDELTRQIRMAGYQLPAGVPALQAFNGNPDTIVVNYNTSGCEVTLASNMLTGNSSLTCNEDVSCFEDGQFAYIFHPDSGGGEWFQISSVDVGGKTLEHTAYTLSDAYAQDAIIVAMSQVMFYIDPNGSSSLILELPGSGPLVYGDDITDLQFRYRLSNGSIVDVPVLIDDVVEVLISVTAESPVTDAETNTKRTRTYSSSASLRNVGL